jgi:hypothetical protein
MVVGDGPRCERVDRPGVAVFQRMKRTTVLASVASALLVSAHAWAFQPTLKNEDSKTYEYEIQCGGSTTHSRINGNTSTTLSSGNGNCKLKVKGAGVVKLADDLKCVIKKGELDCT